MAEECFHCEVAALVIERVKAGTLTEEQAVSNLTQLIGELIKNGIPDKTKRAEEIFDVMKFLIHCAGGNPDKLSMVVDTKEPQPTRH